MNPTGESVPSFDLGAPFTGEVPPNSHVRRWLAECVTLFRRLKDPWGLSAALALAGEAALQEAEPAHARPLLAEHLRLVVRLRMPRSAPWVLRCFARLEADRGEWARAARLLGAADGLGGTPGEAGASDPEAGLPPAEAKALSAARQALGPVPFATAWAEGLALSLDEAGDEALRDEPPAPPPAFPDGK